MPSQSNKRQRMRTSATVQQRARELRRSPTNAEKLLWERLRGRQLKGLKFRRQHPLGRFIADFCCPAQRLIVELDGAVHDTQAERDEDRTAELQQHGYRVLCFRNGEVEQDVEAVLKAIAEAIA
jgi:very-short-patch-repair endonuclease